jgi:hypothetical protein
MKRLWYQCEADHEPLAYDKGEDELPPRILPCPRIGCARGARLVTEPRTVKLPKKRNPDAHV